MPSNDSFGRRQAGFERCPERIVDRHGSIRETAGPSFDNVGGGELRLIEKRRLMKPTDAAVLEIDVGHEMEPDASLARGNEKCLDEASQRKQEIATPARSLNSPEHDGCC